MASENVYIFNSKSLEYTAIETKGKSQYYVSGYITTPDMDLYNDVVTENCMKSMLTQIKSGNVKLDYDHEVFRDSASIIPVGKIIDAGLDSKGLWVKAELNSDSPKFSSLWGSIKGGFVDAFSIAFKPLKTVTKAIGETTARLLDELTLVNVAFTGNPVNPQARITAYDMKSIVKSFIDKTEVGDNKMTEEKLVTITPEQKSEAKVEEKANDEKQKPIVDEKSKEQLKFEELEAKLKSMTDNYTMLQKTLLDQTKLVEELKSKGDALLFKSMPEPMPQPDMKAKELDIFKFIR